MVYRGLRHLDPTVMPKPHLVAEIGGGLGLGIDGFLEVGAALDPVVHSVQVDGFEQGASPFLADLGVVEPFGLPLDQHVADVENHRFDCHVIPLSA